MNSMIRSVPFEARLGRHFRYNAAPPGMVNRPSIACAGTSRSHAQCFFNSLSGAALAGLNALVVEDTQQMTAPLRGRHRLPSSARPRLAQKSRMKYGRQLGLAFQGEQQPFGHPLGSLPARGVALRFADPGANLLARRVAQAGEPFR